MAGPLLNIDNDNKHSHKPQHDNNERLQDAVDYDDYRTAMPFAKQERVFLQPSTILANNDNSTPTTSRGDDYDDGGTNSCSSGEYDCTAGTTQVVVATLLYGLMILVELVCA